MGAETSADEGQAVVSEISIGEGGILRCCLASLEQANALAPIGDHHICAYCGVGWIKDGEGLWRWDRSRIKDGETVCIHGERPFECKECRKP
jgi:hypothetical protein